MEALDEDLKITTELKAELNLKHIAMRELHDKKHKLLTDIHLIYHEHGNSLCKHCYRIVFEVK